MSVRARVRIMHVSVSMGGKVTTVRKVSNKQ